MESQALWHWWEGSGQREVCSAPWRGEEAMLIGCRWYVNLLHLVLQYF